MHRYESQRDRQGWLTHVRKLYILAHGHTQGRHEARGREAPCHALDSLVSQLSAMPTERAVVLAKGGFTISGGIDTAPDGLVANSDGKFVVASINYRGIEPDHSPLTLAEEYICKLT